MDTGEKIRIDPKRKRMRKDTKKGPSPKAENAVENTGRGQDRKDLNQQEKKNQDNHHPREVSLNRRKD